MRTLHILTLNWNGKLKLEKLTPKLVINTQNLQGLNSKWYIRDNGSTDGSVDFIEAMTGVEVLSEPFNHNRDSFAQGINYLFEKANPADDDLVLLLNNDIVFGDDNSLKKMVDLSDKADVVGARLLYENTNKLQHAGVIFSEKYNKLPYHYRSGQESDKNAEKNRYFQAVTAACCLAKAGSFRDIGGMDTGFRWCFDDIDMCLSIKNNGGKIAYCGGTTIYHEESASLKKNPVNKMFLGKNVERFRKKWSGKYEIDHDLYLGNPNYNEIK